MPCSLSVNLQTLQDRLWRLQRLCNMTTYERSMEALCELQQEQAPGAACRLLVESWFNEGCINAAQQAGKILAYFTMPRLRFLEICVVPACPLQSACGSPCCVAC